MKDRHFVKTQRLSDIKGGAGAYEKWAQNHPVLRSKGRLGNRFDMVTEDVRANPDSLTESEGMYANSQLTRPQEIMGEAVEHLQGRQREVYILVVRQGFSFAEAAKKLKISRSAVQIYKARAISFVTQYCKRSLVNG